MFDSQPMNVQLDYSPKVDICMSNYFDIHKLKHLYKWKYPRMYVRQSNDTNDMRLHLKSLFQ